MPDGTGPRPFPSPGDNQGPDISIVMPNWNGEAFLREGLASLFRSASKTGRDFEIVVVDDASTDRSVEIIQKEFPQARLISNSSNQGFAKTCNRGVRASGADTVVLVNNDILAPEDFISAVTVPFFEPAARDPEEAPLFAVGAKTIEFEGDAPNHLCMDAAWERGGIGKVVSDPEERCVTTYVQGGAAAYNRDLFLQLGGFAAIYAPGYWEDYDLSYRAAKAGWGVYYEPRAVLRHLGKGSMARKFGLRRLAQIDERNRLFFNWLNLEDSFLFWRHLLFIPLIYAFDLLTLKGVAGPLGFLRALWGLPALLETRKARSNQDPPPVRTDRDLMVFRFFTI